MGGMAGHCMAWVEYSRQIGRGLHSKWGSECPPLSILPKVSGGNGGWGGAWGRSKSDDFGVGVWV